MEKLTEVLAPLVDMGGYGAYIWPSFATAALVLAAMLIISLRSLARAQRSLARLQQASDTDQ